MCLFLNTDRDPSTGWEGYDYLVKQYRSTAGKADIYRYDAQGDWRLTGEAPFKLEDNELMLFLPRKTVNQTNVQLEFHWADNFDTATGIRSFFLRGDNAPERRSNYLYMERME
jgi:hypothetical protein